MEPWWCTLRHNGESVRTGNTARLFVVTARGDRETQDEPKRARTSEGRSVADPRSVAALSLRIWTLSGGPAAPGQPPGSPRAAQDRRRTRGFCRPGQLAVSLGILRLATCPIISGPLACCPIISGPLA